MSKKESKTIVYNKAETLGYLCENDDLISIREIKSFSDDGIVQLSAPIQTYPLVSYSATCRSLVLSNDESTLYIQHSRGWKVWGSMRSLNLTSGIEYMLFSGSSTAMISEFIVTRNNTYLYNGYINDKHHITKYDISDDVGRFIVHGLQRWQ